MSFDKFIRKYWWIIVIIILVVVLFSYYGKKPQLAPKNICCECAKGSGLFDYSWKKDLSSCNAGGDCKEYVYADKNDPSKCGPEPKSSGFLSQN